MDITQQPLELNIDIYLRTHDGQKLKHFAHSMTVDDMAETFNVLRARVLESLARKKRTRK